MQPVLFTPDQNMALLEFLEYSRDCGLTLDELIEGMKDGSLTVISTTTDIE